MTPLVQNIILSQMPRTMDVSPDNKMFFVADDCCFLSVFDLKTGKVIIKEIDDSAWWLITAKFSPDGQYILTGRSGREGYDIFIWDVESEKLVKTIKMKDREE